MRRLQRLVSRLREQAESKRDEHVRAENENRKQEAMFFISNHSATIAAIHKHRAGLVEHLAQLQALDAASVQKVTEMIQHRVEEACSARVVSELYEERKFERLVELWLWLADLKEAFGDTMADSAPKMKDELRSRFKATCKAAEDNARAIATTEADRMDFCDMKKFDDVLTAFQHHSKLIIPLVGDILDVIRKEMHVILQCGVQSIGHCVGRKQFESAARKMVRYRTVCEYGRVGLSSLFDEEMSRLLSGGAVADTAWYVGNALRNLSELPEWQDYESAARYILSMYPEFSVVKRAMFNAKASKDFATRLKELSAWSDETAKPVPDNEKHALQKAIVKHDAVHTVHYRAGELQVVGARRSAVSQNQRQLPCICSFTSASDGICGSGGSCWRAPWPPVRFVDIPRIR